MKLQNTKDKGKILKVAREKHNVKGRMTGLTDDLSTTTMSTKLWDTFANTPRSTNVNLKTKTSFTIKEGYFYSDREMGTV